MSIEHNARIERASYLTHTDRTEIVISLPGEHDIVRGENITVVAPEAKVTTIWRPRIREVEHAVRNPGRYTIVPDEWNEWSLFLGMKHMDHYLTIPEAMDAAYAHAKTEALKEPS